MSRFVIIVGGGVAAYKALELIRLLKKRGHTVLPVLTGAGAEFITPLSLSALSGEPCHTDLFSADDEANMRHIQISREADGILVVPATADLMAKVANGLANDLASTLLLAANKPILMAPAMNHKMWEHPATQRNFATLQRFGIRFASPTEGEMACGEYGVGRLAELDDLVKEAEALVLATPKPLSGYKIMVTAGPTRELIDGVRYLSNHSSGKQGYAIARAAALAGADVHLVSGPVCLPEEAGVRQVNVETAIDMYKAVEDALPADIAICVAAVADWRPEMVSEQKLKKTSKTLMPLVLKENPDILAALCRHQSRPKLVIGFAAETERHLEHGRAKRAAKQCDWLLINDVSAQSETFGGDNNQITLLYDRGHDVWPLMSKQAVAERLIRLIVQHVSEPVS